MPLCLARFGDVVDADFFTAADPAPLNMVRMVDCASFDREPLIRSGEHSHRADSSDPVGDTRATLARPLSKGRPRQSGAGHDGASDTADGRDDDTNEMSEKEEAKDTIVVAHGAIAGDSPEQSGASDTYDVAEQHDANADSTQRRLAHKQTIVSASAHGLPTPILPADRLREARPRTACGSHAAGPSEISNAIDQPLWCCPHLPQSLVSAIGPLRALAMANAFFEAAPVTVAPPEGCAAAVRRGGSSKKRNGARVTKSSRRSVVGHTSTLAWGFWRDGRLVGPALVLRATDRFDLGARIQAQWALAWDDDGSRSDARFQPAAVAPFVQRVWRIAGARAAGALVCRDAVGALGALMTLATNDGTDVDALIGPAARVSLSAAVTGIVGPGRIFRRDGLRVCETLARLVGVDDVDVCLWYPASTLRSHVAMRTGRPIAVAGTDAAIYRGAADSDGDGDRPQGHGSVYALDAGLASTRETIVYEGAWVDGVLHGWGRLFDPAMPSETHRDARPLFAGCFRGGVPADSGTLSPAPGCVVEAAAWWPMTCVRDDGVGPAVAGAAAMAVGRDGDDDDDLQDNNGGGGNVDRGRIQGPSPRGAGVVHLACGAQLTCDWTAVGQAPIVHAVRHRDSSFGRAVDGGDCAIVVEPLGTPPDMNRWREAIQDEMARRIDAVAQMAPGRPIGHALGRWMATALTAPSLRFCVRCGDSPDAMIIVDFASTFLPWPRPVA
jgi:hypothetical protein